MAMRQRDIANLVSEAVEKSQLQKTYIANTLGIPLAQLSRYLSGKRPFDLSTLDGITELLGLPTGYFYEEYLHDCWNAPRNRSSRIRNFLWHTMINGKMEYTEKMVDLLLESGKVLDDMYHAGEILDQKGMKDEALYFYNMVIENERNRLAECLALSYYRRFMIVREWDMDYAFEAATKLGEHVRTLSGKVMYEAYVNIMTIFFVLDKWDHLIKYGNEVQKIMEKEKEFHAFLYAKCMAYLGYAYRRKGSFAKALEIDQKCCDLPGDQFRIWAELNSCLTLLESGQNDKVYDLIELMKKHRKDAPNNLDHVLKSFLDQKKYREMAWVVSLFPEEVESLFARTDPYNIKKAIRVRYYIADMYLHEGRIEEATNLLNTALNLARKLRLTNQVDECVRMIFQNAKRFNLDNLVTIGH